MPQNLNMCYRFTVRSTKSYLSSLSVMALFGCHRRNCGNPHCLATARSSYVCTNHSMGFVPYFRCPMISRLLEIRQRQAIQ